MRALWAEFAEPKVSEDGLLRHRLYQLGEWEHGDFGKFQLTPELHAEMVKNFAPCNLDYNHEWADVSAGRIEAVEPEIDAEGWAWGISRLTPKAIEYVNSGEYRGFSPEIQFKAKDRKGNPIGCYLAGGGLTNRPFFPIELAAIARQRLAASNPPPVRADIGETIMDLQGREDMATGQTYVTLPAGTVLPDGTTLDADTEFTVVIPEEDAEMAAKKKKAMMDEAAAQAAQVAASQMENAALKASLSAVNSEVGKLKATVAELSSKAEAERTLRLTNEAKLFTTSKHVKPSLAARIEKTYISLGKEEAESLLADIGDLAYIPTGEIGTGAGDEATASGVAAFQAALDTLKASQPNAKLSTLISTLKSTMPRQFAEWERADQVS